MGLDSKNWEAGCGTWGLGFAPKKQPMSIELCREH